MKITSYIHPQRAFLPCTGVGRHMNNILYNLGNKHEVELLVARQWINSKNDQLIGNTPLNELPIRSFPFPENITERIWKTAGYPYMDKYVKDADVVYCPEETYIPLKNKPLVITIHDIQAFETNLEWSNSRQHQLFRKKWMVWIKKIVRNKVPIFTVSTFSKNRMMELLNIPDEQIFVVGNGVEEGFFNTAGNETSPFNYPYVFIVGGLRYKKGADYVIKVAQKAQKEIPDLKFIVAGEQEVKYNNIAKELNNIELLGMVEDLELPRLMRHASSLLFLSLYEGFGIPAIEAMAAGTPVIASNRASLPEIVNKYGVITDPCNTNEIMEYIKTSEVLRKEFEIPGKEYARNYSWDKISNNVESNLKEII